MLRIVFCLSIFFVSVLCFQRAQAQNLAAVSVIRPTAAGMNCGNTPRYDSVEVRISNLDAVLSATGFALSYQLNNGTVITENYSGTLNAGASFNYTFATALYTPQGGVNSLKVFTSLLGDVNRANDTLVFTYTPRVSSYPYFESFENNNGGFSAGGNSSSWVWGDRNKPNTGQSADGTKSWTNGGLNGYYNNSDASYLRSPCYDFSNLTNPYIAFQFVVEVEYNYEVITMQYSLNGGASWITLGAANDPDNCETKNWYNNGLPGWSGNARSYPCSFGWGGGCAGKTYCGSWSEAKRCLSQLAGQPSVMFQWAFTSTGTQCTAEGFALDSLVIGEAPQATPFNFSFIDSVCPGVPIQFTSTLSSCYSNPRWDFGDNTGLLYGAGGFHAFRNGGTYTANLIVDGLCGSVDTLKKQVFIRPFPITTIDPVGEKLCISGATVNLQATPAGGTFFVNTTQQNTIDPAALGLGKHYATYTYTDPLPNGCTVTDSVFFQVYTPSAAIDNLGGQYCPAAPAFVLQGSPTGGIFFINGVRDSLFNPTALGLGTHSVTYVYQDSIACPASASQVVDINNSLVVNLDPLLPMYCKGDAAVPLTATPTGGVFTINGVNAASYDPSIQAATAGQDTVVYFYTDGFCSNADTLFVDVVNPILTINGVNPLYCSSAGNVTPTATPAGGIFTLNGNTIFNFTPANLATGNHRLVYTFQDPTYGCIDSIATTITIDRPTASITNLLPNYCIDKAKTTLTATPTGGVFTVNGTTAIEIDPSLLGLGQHRVIYTYTNPNGCIAKDTHDFSVVPLPVLNFVSLPKTLCFNSNPISISTNPSGGIISIDGFPSSATFDPSLYASGQYHVIDYQFVDFAFGCVNSIKDSIYIGIPPSVSINQLDGTYCNTDKAFVLSGNPAGGQFTINGTPQTSFNPASFAAGTYTVKYTYQDANGCENEITQFVDIINNPGDTITPGPIVEICSGEELVLNVKGSLPGVWSTNETTASITVKPLVTTDYWYQVNGCASYFDSVKVIVHENPVADFALDPTQGFVALDVTATSNLTNATVEKWVFDGVEYTQDPATHTFTQPGTFDVVLYVTDANGCKDSMVQSVTIFEGIQIPNVFTPNGDASNDDFGPITQSTFSQYNFKIYDRWGALMFEAFNPTDRWDGTFNGQPVPEGTYFYLLQAKNLKEFKLEGTVNVIR